MSDAEREQLLKVLRGLMVAENFGDVHEEIDVLRLLLGLPKLAGDFLDGWAEEDWIGTGAEL